MEDHTSKSNSQNPEFKKKLENLFSGKNIKHSSTSADDLPPSADAITNRLSDTINTATNVTERKENFRLRKIKSSTNISGQRIKKHEQTLIKSKPVLNPKLGTHEEKFRDALFEVLQQEIILINLLKEHNCLPEYFNNPLGILRSPYNGYKIKIDFYPDEAEFNSAIDEWNQQHNDYPKTIFLGFNQRSQKWYFIGYDNKQQKIEGQLSELEPLKKLDTVLTSYSNFSLEIQQCNKENKIVTIVQEWRQIQPSNHNRCLLLYVEKTKALNLYGWEPDQNGKEVTFEYPINSQDERLAAIQGKINNRNYQSIKDEINNNPEFEVELRYEVIACLGLFSLDRLFAKTGGIEGILQLVTYTLNLPLEQAYKGQFDSRIILPLWEKNIHDQFETMKNAFVELAQFDDINIQPNMQAILKTTAELMEISKISDSPDDARFRMNPYYLMILHQKFYNLMNYYCQARNRETVSVNEDEITSIANESNENNAIQRANDMIQELNTIYTRSYSLVYHLYYPIIQTRLIQLESGFKLTDEMFEGYIRIHLELHDIFSTLFGSIRTMTVTSESYAHFISTFYNDFFQNQTIIDELAKVLGGLSAHFNRASAIAKRISTDRDSFILSKEEKLLLSKIPNVSQFNPAEAFSSLASVPFQLVARMTNYFKDILKENPVQTIPVIKMLIEFTLKFNQMGHEMNEFTRNIEQLDQQQQSTMSKFTLRRARKNSAGIREMRRQTMLFQAVQNSEESASPSTTENHKFQS